MDDPVKRYHTPLAFGEKRRMTPEGFLVCLNVPMARTGVMRYGPRETLIQSRDGFSPVDIHREAQDVFAPDTVMSIIGKPVTNGHPPEDVSPVNWKNYAVGSVLTAKRGEGEFADLLIGDIMITDARAIQDILDGKKEVSCGYDADYEELEPGVGRQKNIHYNHLALVNRGRCGPRCAIGDYQPEENTMGKKTLLDRVRAFMKDGAEIQEELEKSEAAADEAVPSTKPGGDVHIHIGTNGVSKSEIPSAAEKTDATDEGGAAVGQNANGAENGNQNEETKAMDPAVEARFTALETGMKQIAAAIKKLSNAGQAEEVNAEEMVQEAPDNIDMKTVRDSAVFQDSFRETVSLAEIIAPGIRVPTFDAKASPRSTFDAICNFRRTVLDVAYAQPATRGMIDDLHGNKKFDTKCMTCDAIRGLFRALGVARRSQNNDSATGGRGMVTPGQVRDSVQKNKINSPADLNRIIRERKAAAVAKA